MKYSNTAACLAAILGTSLFGLQSPARAAEPESTPVAPPAAAPAPVAPSADALALPAIPDLPDPFKFQNGSLMKSKADWSKRREELSLLIQKYQYGPYPAKPDKVTGTMNGDTLNVKVDYQGKSINYNVRMSRPQGDGPFPAIVLISGMMPGLNAQTLNARGVATLVLQPNEIAADAKNPLRAGKLYTLYGTDCKTSALMGWGWAVHRIIDALETTPDAKIDPKHIGVTGYSRYGKGAIVAGAFDERIALTIPGGSGAGGVGLWRAEENVGNVQKLSQIIGEAPQWFTDDFGANFRGRTQNLPFDSHEIVALVAPRALIIQEGTQDSWNNNANGGPYQSAWAAKRVFDYLDLPDNIGWTSDPHSHGTMTARELAGVMKFVDHFLLQKKDVDTKVWDETAKPPAIAWKAPETK